VHGNHQLFWCCFPLSPLLRHCSSSHKKLVISAWLSCAIPTALHSVHFRSSIFDIFIHNYWHLRTQLSSFIGIFPIKVCLLWIRINTYRELFWEACCIDTSIWIIW
jgi:hypothetical protein